FRNSKIKEIIQVKFSSHFFENVIRKGYLYFDRQDLLQIENPISRTLFLMLTKWRNKELYIKRYSNFLASRIPLSWKKNNIPGTLARLKEAFEILKKNRVIKEFRFSSENRGINSYFEIWFDEVHNKNYLLKNKSLESLNGNQEAFEITNQISEILNYDVLKNETILENFKTKDNAVGEVPLIEKEITKQTRELLALLPEKARTLTTMEKKVEKAIKKHGYDYTKGAVLYTNANAKSSFGKYFDGTIAQNWHEEFMNTQKEQLEKEKLAKEKAAKLESKQLEIKLQESQEQKNKEVMKAKYLSLPEEEQSKIEKIVYTDYITKAGGNATKIVKNSFERAKLALIAEYLKEVNYFSEKKMIIESQLIVKSNEPKTMSEPERIVEAGEKRRDMGSLLGGLMGNLTVKNTNKNLVKSEFSSEPVEKDSKIEILKDKEPQINNEQKNEIEIITDKKEMAEIIKNFAKNITFMYSLDEDIEFNLKVEVVEIILNSENVTKELIRDTFKKLVKKYS
ncbi:MAG: hypothetical protein ACRC0V_04530, partial [Fusobacteriaceae bacterium]